MNSDEIKRIFKGLGIGSLVGLGGLVVLFCWDLLVGIWNCMCGMIGTSPHEKGVADSTYIFVFSICAGIGLLIGICTALASYFSRKPPKTKTTPTPEPAKKTINTPSTKTNSNPKTNITVPVSKTVDVPVTENINKTQTQSRLDTTSNDKTEKKVIHLRNDNKTLFEKYLSYAKEGGIIYNYYVGKDYVYGIEKGEKAYPKGLKADVSKAIPYLQYASEREYEDAQFLLGLVYSGWYDESYKDEIKATQWIGRAARLEHKDAQYLYANRLLNGDGIDQNKEEAYYWYLESANHGQSDAMMQLCHYYMDKLLEFPEDMTDEEDDEFQEYVWDSFCWARYAAEYDNDEGMYMLGVFYFQGFGGTVDLEKSRKYLDLAVQKGNEDAQQFIDENF